MNSPSGITSRPCADRTLAASNAESRGGVHAIGSWTLTQVVQRGRWTTLYRARPESASKGPGCYVVKAANSASSQWPISRAMVAREAVVAAAISHPNLTAILASQVRGPGSYLVLPYLEGVTLRQLLTAARQPTAAASAFWIVRQVAEGLAALHQSGWLHGQVRPEHVILSPQGHATVIDLALCRRLETDECKSSAMSNESTTYTSPEAIAAHPRLSPASDVYCLGLLLFELLAGRPPFQSADPGRILEMHRSQSPPDIRAMRPDALPEAAQLLRLMLAKEPLRRPSDSQIVRWLSELEIAALAP